jgi:hypothetical protein
VHAIEHVVTQLQRKTGRTEHGFEGPQLFVAPDHQRAGRGAMQPSMAQMQHVERHHPGQHDVMRQVFAQGGHVAQAVLEADHHRSGSDPRSHLPGGGSGIAGLHCHQHQRGIAQGLHPGVEADLALVQLQAAAVQVGQQHAVVRNQPAHALAPDQAHVGVFPQMSADEAADAAGADHGDPGATVVHSLEAWRCMPLW